MKNRKRKGFTLIELLAVIVILAIIALIATPMIMGVIEKARKGAAENSARYYIEGVENTIVMSMLDNKEVPVGKQVIDSNGNIPNYEISVKGEKPKEGNMCMDEKGKVTSYSLKVGKYYMTSLDGKTLEHTDSIQELDCSGSVVATPKSNDYDLEEKVIGAWIDGKPLYRKGFKGIVGQGANSVANIALLDLSEFHIDVFINVYGTMLTDEHTNYIPIPYVGGSAYFLSLYYKITTQMLYLTISEKYNSYTDNEYVIFIEYTKTTDSVS